jgi:hypothetical protein
LASIASVYVDILPTTGKIADGIRKALLGADDDVRKAAQRWKRIIDRELSKADAEVTVDADTKPAEKKIERLEKEKHTAHVGVEVDKASLVKARALIGGAGGGGSTHGWSCAANCRRLIVICGPGCGLSVFGQRSKT